MSPSREQIDRALDRANEIRLARAELKRRIASGEIYWAKAHCLDCNWRYQGYDAVDRADAHHDEEGHRTCAREEAEVHHR